MKSAFILTTAISLLASAVRGSPSPAAELGLRGTDGYVQKIKGSASFTWYTGCQQPGKQCESRHFTTHAEYRTVAACGEKPTGSGYTAAMSQLSFGAPPGLGGGDACGRCFHLVANYDPYDPGFKVPSKGITVKVTDLCPVQGNEQWCGQSTQHPVNNFNASMQYVVALPAPCV
jgi:hypothetical protein